MNSPSLHNPLKKHVAELIHQGLSQQSEASLTLEEVYSALVQPPDSKMGDFAFPCFPLAKALKMSPAKISEKLASAMPGSEKVEKFISAGPYLNSFISASGWDQDLVSPLLAGELLKGGLKKSAPKTMIEFSQPNTHKELHVGHTRNMCLGNALARIIDYTQGHLISVTYPGDMGTHVAKCLWFLKKFDETPPASEKGAWLGQIYTKAHLKLEDEKGTENEAKNREELTAILQQLESGQGEYFDLWQETREWSIDLMKSAYEWADVHFDRWYFESEVDSASLDYAKELETRGIAKRDQGALGVDLNEYNLGFCILIKSDGNGLYATKDLELAQRKFDEGVQKSLYVVDFRQSHHFKQVFKILEMAGVLSEEHQAHHISYEMVDMPDGAMSSRKGNIIPLMQLVREMEQTVRTEYLDKFQDQWSEEEITATAKAIADGAIKYGMLRVDNNRKITFEMKDWLKLDGDTGPYLQYVHARICSLLAKSAELDLGPSESCSLSEPHERKLLSKLLWFNDVVEQCSDQYKTIHLTSYLFELGKAFNSFYAECPIAKCEDENVRKDRLRLSKAVALTMAKGLNLLGIQAPQKM